MQALRKEENLVFYRTINGVSTRTEVTRDEMDSLIVQEVYGNYEMDEEE